jgi:ABC-2 type transport system permease protein
MLQQRKWRHLASFGLLLGLVFVLNLLSQTGFFRIDLTEEGRYSLSDSTVAMLESMEEPAIITVYLEGDFPANFKRLRNATQELLDEFRSYGGSNLQYRFVDPFAGKNKEEQAQMYQELIEKGLKPFTVSFTEQGGSQQKMIFPEAIVAYRGRETRVPLLQNQQGRDPEVALNQSIEQLEFAFASGLYKLHTYESRPKVALSFGHGELPQGLMADFLETLKDYYVVEAVEIKNDLEILTQAYRCLIVAKPYQAFDDASKFIIDQYIMHGGRVLWLVDPVLTSMDSLRTTGLSYTVAVPQDLNLNDMFFRYGFRMNYDLVQDARCAFIPVVTGMDGDQPREELLPWFYYPVVVPGSQHFLSENVGPIRLEFASTVDTVNSQGVQKSILLTSSDLTRVPKAPTRVALQSVSEIPVPERFNQPNRTLAVLLEGRFSSAFQQRIVPKANKPFKAESEPTRMIAVADGDIVKNKFSASRQQPFPLGLDPVSGVYYPGNKNFLLNCVNYLADDGWFIPLRNKRFQIRLLNRKAVEEKGRSWQTFNVVFPLAFMLIFAFLFNFVRNRRFRKHEKA